jgi:hypothetical protein
MKTNATEFKELFIKDNKRLTEMVSQHPQLLQDATFLLANLLNLNLKLSQYPEDLQKNHLFLTEYFSTKKSNAKEYTKIPSELLSNPLFISKILPTNPDIYLLAPEHTHSDSAFLKIKFHYHNAYLKYDSPENINNLEYCTKAVTQCPQLYQYLIPEFKTNLNICEKVFKRNSPQKEELIKFIPNELINDNSFLIKLIYHWNMAAFINLPDSFHKDKNLCLGILSQDTTYFKYVATELKEDKEWVYSILNLISRKPNPYAKNPPVFNLKDIIVYLPLDYYTPKFCTKFQDTIRANFSSLPKTHKADETVLKSVFEVPHDPAVAAKMVTLDFLNNIAIPELKTHLKDISKTNNGINDFAKTHLFEKYINSYFLNNKLQEDLKTNDSVTKKHKI